MPILSGNGRNWLCSLAFLVIPLTGCGTPDPELETPANTVEPQRSANFVSARPSHPPTTSRVQQSTAPANDFNRFSQFRIDPAIPNDNPWARPANPPPSSTTPGYSQAYTSAPPGRTYPGTQPPAYRYRPLSKKEIQEIQRQQHWSAESQYWSQEPYTSSPQPAPSPPAVNPWDSRNQWGRYPPSRHR